MTETEVRTPEEIESLYQRIKKKKAKEGISYTKADFVKDCGLSGRAGTYSDWTTDPDNASFRRPSTPVNHIMDMLEDQL